MKNVIRFVIVLALLALLFPLYNQFRSAPVNSLTLAKPADPLRAKAFAILGAKCADCHTLEGALPFYAALPVIGKLIKGDIQDGLKAINYQTTLAAAPDQPAGEVLLVTWGSSWGPAREALNRIRNAGVKAGHLHIRHVHPLPNGLEEIFKRYHRIVVAELNDEGVYGFGQFTMMLRARYANPAIVSVTKTDGLTFKVSEIVAGVANFIESTALEATIGITRQSALAQR